MIDRLFNINNQTQLQQPQIQRVLTYVKNERMGGFVPKYEMQAVENKNNVEKNIETSMVGSQGGDVLSYKSSTQTNHNNDFGFGDILDMINPLQHIPVVGHIYREITGDQIKPISKIIGGAAFSGPIGAASGLIDTIITAETGQDISNNALNFALNRKTTKPMTPPPQPAQNTTNSPANDYALTSALLAYSDLASPATATPHNNTNESNEPKGLYALSNV